MTKAKNSKAAPGEEQLFKFIKLRETILLIYNYRLVICNWLSSGLLLLLKLNCHLEMLEMFQ